MPIYRAFKIVDMYTTKDYEAENEGQARAMAVQDMGQIAKIEELPPPPPPPIEVEPPVIVDDTPIDAPLPNDSGFDNGGGNNS